MAEGNGNSDSQASLVLANLKDRREPSKLSSGSESHNSHVTCTDSTFSQRNTLAIARHGLATQTETQLNDPDEGSQKENINSPRAPSDLKTQNDSLPPKGSRSPAPNATKLKGNAVAFQSPSRQKPTANMNNNRSPLAASRTKDGSESPNNRPKILAPASDQEDSSQSQNQDESQNRPEEPLAIPDEDLPDGYQSSQNDEGAQPREEYLDDFDIPVAAGSTSTSQDSQDAFWNDRDNYDPKTRAQDSDPPQEQSLQDQSLIETQPAGSQFVETQPVSQMDDNNVINTADADEVPDEDWNPLLPSDPRALANNIDKFKRARYFSVVKESAAARSAGTDANPPSDSRPVAAASSDAVLDQLLEETQLAEEVDVPRRSFPPPRVALRATGHSDSGVASDTLDIVPDSEPARGSPAKTPSLQQPPVASTSRSSPKKRKRPLLEDEEVVPDSTEAEPHSDFKGIGEEEDEDDIPLATIIGNREKKRADETVNSLEQMPPPPPPPGRSTRSKDKQKASTPATVRGSARSKKTVGDSNASTPAPSIPEETPVKTGSSSKAKGKKKTPAAKPVKDTPAPKRRRLSGNQGASGSKTRATSELSSVPDTATEIAPEDAMDIDQPGGSSVGRSTRKRSTVRAASSTRTPGLATRSTTSDILQPVERIRVFALWKQDAHYYAGTISAQNTKTETYTVEFDDNTIKHDISIEDMRVLDLRPGDNIVYGKGIIGTVDRVVNPHVFISTSGKKKAHKVLLQQVLISSKTINSEWADRRLTKEMVELVEDEATGEQEPRDELAKEVPVPGDHFLNGCGIIATFSAGLPQDEREKNISRLRSILARHGGQLVGDWHNVLTLEGKVGPKNAYWYIEKKGVCLREGKDFKRLFLMADELSQKTKFLFALAMGVPCLELQWLFEDEKAKGDSKIHEWNRHLLAQGYSDYLNARISQAIDLDWGNSPCHLKEIMENRVPPKLFSGMSILCIGREIESDIRNLQRVCSIPHIVLGMGASRVEFAMAWKSASKEKLKCDYIIFGLDAPLEVTEKAPDCKVVTWKWVKQCLITGRMLPLPAP